MKIDGYYRRVEFWEAWYVVSLSKLLGCSKYTYAWWESRLKLIKSEKI